MKIGDYIKQILIELESVCPNWTTCTFQIKVSEELLAGYGRNEVTLTIANVENEYGKDK